MIKFSRKLKFSVKSLSHLKSQVDDVDKHPAVSFFTQLYGIFQPMLIQFVRTKKIFQWELEFEFF